MRVLIFHGYLLHGTGSNVYNAELATALAALGHEVHLVCQEREPFDVAGVTVHNPDIGRLLPVYVADRYPGFDARTFLECSDAEVETYVERNVAAVRDVAARVRPDVALANHLIMGPVILARGLGGEVPYAVKVHGSALEYVVKRDPARFLPWAREGLAGARGVLVGSRHTGESLWAAMGDDGLPGRTRLGPPGVDLDRFRPAAGPEEAAAALRELAAGLGGAPDPRAQGADAHAGIEGGPSAGHVPPSAFTRDLAAAGRALARLDPERERLVVFVGKLIVSKGVDLLLAAWPLVLRDEPRARLVVVGFGAYRDGFERLLGALERGDLTAVRAIGEEGRALEGGPGAPLRHLLAFLDSLDGDEREEYLAAASTLGDRVVMTGRLEHSELAGLLPACDAQVVPSTFPEAFGMVAAEAAACGVLPVSAAHSGLVEVTRELAANVPEAARGWLAFDVGDGAVRDLAAALTAWLGAPDALRATVRDALAETARGRYGWPAVAESVIAAARGDLDALRRPA